MHPLHLPGSFFFFIIIIIIIITFVLIHAPKVASSVDERYANCSRTFACGHIGNIGYPFWGSDRPDYCGCPGFQLNCGDSIPKIKIKSATYHVLGINNESRLLNVARADYRDDLCPAFLINTTLNRDLFEFTPDTQDIDLYYCLLPHPPTLPSPPPTSPTPPILPTTIQDQAEIEKYFRHFTCNVSFCGYYPRNLSESPDYIAKISGFLGSCVERVVLAANQSEIQFMKEGPNLRGENLAEALAKGFGLQWKASNSLCDRCRGSGGQCGYNTVSNKFSCYCTDRPYDTVCPTPTATPTGNKIGTPLNIGLFLAGGIIAGILLGGWWFSCYQRRKRIAAQSQSKDLPATPPSSKGLGPTTLSTMHSESIPSYSSAKSDLEKGSTYFGVQVFNYADLEEATHNFDPSKVLGDGGFGTVYYGVLGDGCVVAVKRLYENNLKRVEQFINEIKILADLRHPNLVTLYGCTSRHSRELLLVYEYIPNGTVADHLHGRRAKSGLLTWHVRLCIALETANALAYLHSKEIIHRDVKTNNILLDNNFHVKVADFGLSRLFPNDVTHVSTAPQGTPGYVDPEYYQCYHLTDKSDVYSFGVVLIELISTKQAVDTNRHRFDINLANMAISRIQNQALHELVDPSLAFETDFAVRTMITTVAELAFRCLQKERDMRPSMEEVLGVLKGMQNKESEAQFAEVVNIGADDVGLLRHVPPPVSSDSGETEKWGQIRTM